MSTLSQLPPRSTDGSQMAVKITEYKPDKCSFILEGVELGLANALRRSVIADVATLGGSSYLGYNKAAFLTLYALSN